MSEQNYKSFFEEQLEPLIRRKNYISCIFCGQTSQELELLRPSLSMQIKELMRNDKKRPINAAEVQLVALLKEHFGDRFKTDVSSNTKSRHKKGEIHKLFIMYRYI